MDEINEKAVSTLNRLGFTEYEAKAYISLIRYGMATAREIHEHSGVPQGRIYSVLKSLTDKEYIKVNEGNPSYYYSTSPTATLTKLRNEINQSIDETTEYLTLLHLNSRPPESIWVLHTEESIKNRLRTLMQSAEKSVMIGTSDMTAFSWVKPEIPKLKKKVSLEIFTARKSDFAGTKLRVTEYSPAMIRFSQEIQKLPVHGNHSQPDRGSFFIFDETTCLFIAREDGKYFGTTVLVPHLTYMLKAMITVLEKNDIKI